DRPDWFPDDIKTRLLELRMAAEALTKAGEGLVDRLLELIGGDSPLGRALNELMSLFTPARWAYEDLASKAQIGGGSPQLELTLPAGGTSSIPAQLRWNTAELNACAIGLFLLCARSARNPYRTIVLDDPLQNMDELTVIAVTRGMGRLLRLWSQIDSDGSRWRVALLLHSEEHADRVRRELPCAYYSLPWLSPAERQGAALPAIEAATSRVAVKLQELGGLGSLPTSQPSAG